MTEELTRRHTALLDWYGQNARALPWRRDREPYHVWLSEIMLQQTRVEAVKGYYLRFLQALPTVEDLAGAPEDRLLKLWEGLGYYTRVRNLQKAAQQIMAAGAGFPKTYEAVRALPGVGAYTAGAICSICYELPTPAVDGNVLRVMSRMEASFCPIDKPAAKKEAAGALAPLYALGRCGDVTQALMELGATVCGPNRPPVCGDCPWRQACRARALGCQTQLPVKAGKKPRRKEEKTVFLLRCRDRVALVKRPEKGLLAGLWAYPHTDGALSAQEAADWAEQAGCRPGELIKTVKKTHVFTHVEWEMTGVYLTCREQSPEFRWASEEELEQEVGLPTAFGQFSRQSRDWGREEADG